MSIFKQTIVIKIILCTLVATFLALTTHIWVLEFTKPFLYNMTQNATAQGIKSLDSSNYPKIILYLAYATAFMTTGVLVFIYYHCQNLIPGPSKFKKLIFTIAIIFGIKAGDLIRQPIMDLVLNYTIGFHNPVLFVTLSHADKWLANLLLAGCLVYFCPQKNLT